MRKKQIGSKRDEMPPSIYLDTAISRPRGASQAVGEPARCLNCGAEAVRLHSRPRRTVSYRTMLRLALPHDVSSSVCDNCKSEYFDENTGKKLAPLVREAYLGALRNRVRTAIDRLSLFMPQRRLEQLLGMSQGYLSRLRGGTSSPSPALVSHLALLSLDPLVRLAELVCFWESSDRQWVRRCRGLINDNPHNSSNDEKLCEVDPTEHYRFHNETG